MILWNFTEPNQQPPSHVIQQCSEIADRLDRLWFYGKLEAILLQLTDYHQPTKIVFDRFLSLYKAYACTKTTK
jgi:hypothetical protein